MNLIKAFSKTGRNEMDNENYEKLPYRATKLWTDAINSFRESVPLGRHRTLLRQHDQCFIASDAITWFTNELNEKFDVGINRKQTLKLLQKFYKAGVFAAVSNSDRKVNNIAIVSSTNVTQVNETDFKDNRKLYRILNQHGIDRVDFQSKSPNTTGSDNSKGKGGDFYVVIKELSMADINKIWEESFTQRFVETFGYDVFTSFLKPGAVNGHWIRHNLTKLSSTGIVMTEHSDDELPCWITNAMKFTTRWPNGYRTEDVPFCPTYPGFEIDVFDLIRDYFNGFKGIAPLLTFDLYDPFVTMFIRGALYDSGLRIIPNVPKKSCIQKLSQNPRRSIQEKYPFSASDSTENLLMALLTPPNSNGPKALMNFVDKPLLPKRILTNSQQGNNSETPEPRSPIQPMEQRTYSYDLKQYTQTSVESKAPIFLETAFTGTTTPVTRIISKTELDSSLGALRKCDLWNTSGTPTKHPFAYDNPNLQLSPADTINHPKYSRLLHASGISSELCELSTLDKPLKAVFAKTTVSLPHNGLSSTVLHQSIVTTPLRNCRSQSAANLSDSYRDRCPYFPGRPSTAKQHGLLEQIRTSPSRSAQKTLKLLSGSNTKQRYMMTSEAKSLIITSFRLLTLLLPPKNRRYLHILLQFMEQVAGNDKLMLDAGSTCRAYVITEFCRAIFGCSSPSEYDEFLALQIVTFLMDNESEIFDVTKEGGIVASALEEIRQQQIQKVPMNASSEQTTQNKENNCPLFASQRVSMDEYENHLKTTGQSLRDLLCTVDALEDKKQRKKLMKKFQREYPHIYAEKYGPKWELDDELSCNSPGSVPEKETTRPLRMLKNVRSMFS